MCKECEQSKIFKRPVIALTGLQHRNSPGPRHLTRPHSQRRQGRGPRVGALRELPRARGRSASAGPRPRAEAAAGTHACPPGRPLAGCPPSRGSAEAAPHGSRGHLRESHLSPATRPERPQPGLSPRQPNRLGDRKRKEGRRSDGPRGGRAQPPSATPAPGEIQSVPVAMKTGHTPAGRARGSPVRSRARPAAHEQCRPEPASHGLRRQRRRCRCHYGPLQSEGGGGRGVAGGVRAVAGRGVGPGRVWGRRRRAQVLKEWGGLPR